MKIATKCSKVIALLCIFVQIGIQITNVYADTMAYIINDTFDSLPYIAPAASPTPASVNWIWESTVRTGTAAVEQIGGMNALHIKSASSGTTFANLLRILPATYSSGSMTILVRFLITETGARPMCYLYNSDNVNIGELWVDTTNSRFIVKDGSATINKYISYNFTINTWTNLYINIDVTQYKYGIAADAPTGFTFCNLMSATNKNFNKLVLHARSTYPDGLYINTIVASQPSSNTSIDHITVNNRLVAGFNENNAENDYYLPLGDKLGDFNLSSNKVDVYTADPMASVTKSLVSSNGATYIQLSVTSSDGKASKGYRLNIKSPKIYNSYTPNGSNTTISTVLRNNAIAKNLVMLSANVDTSGNENNLTLTPVSLTVNEEKTISNTLPTNGDIVTMIWKDLISFEPVVSSVVYTGSGTTQTDVPIQLSNPVISNLAASSEGDIVNVSGTIAGTYGQMVSVVIPDPDKGIAALAGQNPDKSAILYATQAITQNGTFSIDIPLNYVGLSENFKAYIGSSNLNTPYEKAFLFIPKGIRNNLIGQLNSTISESAMLDIFENAQNLRILTAMGLKMELFNLLSPGLKASVVTSLYKTVGTLDENTLRVAFNNDLVMQTLTQAKSADEILTIIRTYNNIFQLPLQIGSDFANLSSEEQAEAYNIIFARRSELETVNKFRNEFSNFILLAKVNKAVFATIKGIIELNFNKFPNSNSEIAYYNTINNNAYKISIIYNDILMKKYQTCDELETTFRGAVDKVMNLPSESSRSSTTVVVTKPFVKPTIAPTQAPTASPEKPDTSIGFTDISGVSWAKDAIDILTRKNIVNGISEGIFAPNRNIKREELIKMVVNAFGIYDKNAKANFSDVTEADWSYSFISSAVNAKIIVGIGNDKFGKGEDITRQELATILYRVAMLTGTKLEQKVQAQSFSDFESIDEYAKQAVSELQKSNIIKGFGNNFNPALHATRAQAAKMIYNLLNLRGDAQ